MDTDFEISFDKDRISKYIEELFIKKITDEMDKYGTAVSKLCDSADAINKLLSNRQMCLEMSIDDQIKLFDEMNALGDLSKKLIEKYNF